MTIEANKDADQKSILMQSIGIMVVQAVAVLVAVVSGLILILLNVGNGIKGVKLGWFMLIHPSQWLSVGTIVGMPVWEVFALASILLGAGLIYEMLRLVRRPLQGQMPRLKKIALGSFLLIAAPLLTFMADTGQWWVMKHAFNYETKMYVLTGVQNDYERWLRKTFSFASEKDVQRDLLAGFRNYFRDEELEILEDDVAANTKQVDWWHVEYSDLIKVITQSPHRALVTTYRAGSTGSTEGRLKASIGKDGGMVLQLVLAMSGSLAEQVNATHVTTVVRDNDGDGLPDEFQTIPKLEMGYTGPVTLEGFIPLTPGPLFDDVYVLWSQGIGYAVNFFLHGYDSSLPRGLLPQEDTEV